MNHRLGTERSVRVCAVAGALTTAFSSILVGLSHASPSTAAFFRCAYALPLLWLIALREHRRLGRRPWRERGIAIASGVFFAADLILWHNSIADIGAGLATVLANVQVVLVPLIAWAVLRERPGKWLLAAIPIALGGVLLISGVLEDAAYGRYPERGTLYGLGAGVAYAGFLLLLRRSGSDLRRSAGPLFDATATATVACLAAGFLIGDLNLSPRWPGAGWLIALALSSQVFGWLLITASLPRLPAAIGSMLLALQPVGSVALAAVILSEAPSPLQLVGVAVVLGALIVATSRTRTRDRRASDSQRGSSQTRLRSGGAPSANDAGGGFRRTPGDVFVADFEHWNESARALDPEPPVRIARYDERDP